MNTVTTTLTTVAQFSEDGTKRYLLQKTWDTTKPNLAIVILAPSGASDIALDNTTLLVLNNADRLGYGSVSIVNLFATLNDFALKQAEEEDTDNLEVIVNTAETADLIVYAPGTGKSANNAYQERQKQILTVLEPFQGKLHCLCGAEGNARLQHPLSPAVRTWNLSPLQVSELLPKEKTPSSTPEQKKEGQKTHTEN